MSLLSKIKQVLEEEEACSISQNGTPIYAVIKWEKYQKIIKESKDLKIIKEEVDKERAEEENIDINKIPV
ncbi:MAG: hypothetical protein WC705_02090 [Candidatus Paceibacterota bacterium]|jgi:hypothetical protein